MSTKLIKHYQIYDHKVTVSGEEVTCPTCSLSSLQVKAVRFMAENAVHSLVVEGCPINFHHVEINA
jgi:hypothetical protein